MDKKKSKLKKKLQSIELEENLGQQLPHFIIVVENT